MACLLQELDSWIESEPPELESDHPSEEEISAFEEAEKEHIEKVSIVFVCLLIVQKVESYKPQFELIESIAARLSSSLGVGTLSSKIPRSSVFEFIKEGVRVSFSTIIPGHTDEFALGSRLAFLRLVSR
jgi:cohesin complex subunit SA-1/2